METNLVEDSQNAIGKNLENLVSILQLAYALNSGHPEFVDYLLTMAEVEWEHERYFRSRAMLHPFAKWIPIWEIPPEKDQIRRSFLLEAESTFSESQCVIEI